MADASSTTLFTLRGLASLREQFINQRRTPLYILPRTALRPLDSSLLGRDAQFVIFDPQHDLIPNLDAEGLAKGRRNHDTSVLVYACSGFC